MAETGEGLTRLILAAGAIAFLIAAETAPWDGVSLK